MVSFEQALALVKSIHYRPSTEQTGLDAALGRVLADNVYSDMDMPPFDKASVDGYACRISDIGEPLRLIETVAAGQVPTRPIEAGQCTKIMTGAKVPDGADCVVMVEHTKLDFRGNVIVEIVPQKSNIAKKAEDIKQGAVVLKKGTLLKAHHLAVAAGAGATVLSVARRPVVYVFSTGNELVPPQSKPLPGQIRDSNSSQLIALLNEMHLEPQFGGIIPDHEGETYRVMKQALEKADVLLLSGGISMGDFDYIPGVLQKLGFEIRFKSLAVQPGRPTVFAQGNNQFILALPGNPVSTLNIFRLLGVPFLYHLMGHDFVPPLIRLRLSVDFRRKNAERMLFVPVCIAGDGRIVPLDYHGSAHINALSAAHGLMIIPSGITELKADTEADVRLF